MLPDPTTRPLDYLAIRGAADAVALIVGDERLTYAELDSRVGRLAATLLVLGLAPGDRVATWMGKTLLACLMPLAAARAGLVHVPINPVLKHAQAGHIFTDSGARLLIANRARLTTLVPGQWGDARLIILEEWEEGPKALGPSTHAPETLAALLYTSGSTGLPKGVMLSHANLWLGALSVAQFLGLGAQDRTLCLLPLAFDYGQNQLFSIWAAGGTAVAFDHLLIRDVVRAVGHHGVTVLAGVPPLWRQLTDADWSGGQGATLATLTNSGGHLPEPIVRQLRALFPNARLHLMYGLTEAFRSASLDPALVDTHPDAVGTAIPFAELMIVRPDGTSASPGEEGELVHAGPLVAHGYWRDPEKTRERFRPAPSFSHSGGTAVWSGDRMLVGEDGLLRFRGRDNAMIKVSGNRLSPTEVEEAALASGTVSDAAAFAIPHAEWGESVALFAVGIGPEPETRLLAWFAANTPAYMKPQRILLLDALPLGPTGKVDRACLAGRL